MSPSSRLEKCLQSPRLGLYGGSFDPPHAGHLAVLRAARRFAGLDAVVLVPAARSPHKRDPTRFSDAQRLALTELLIAREPKTAVWDLELHRPPPSFTVETLETLCQLRGADLPRPALILGSDQLPGLGRWQRVQRVFELAQPLVVQRGTGAEFEGALSAAAQALPWLATRLLAGAVRMARPHPASSTRIRAALAAGQRPVPHLPAPLLRSLGEGRKGPL